MTDPARPGSFTWRAVLVVGLPALAVLATAAVVFFYSVGPIDPTMETVGGSGVDGTHWMAITPPGGNAGVYAVDWRDDGAFQLFFDIENTGNLPLTFAPVSNEEDFDAFKTLEYALEISTRDGIPDESTTYVRAEGTQLPADETRILRVTWRFTQCPNEGLSKNYEKIDVRYGYRGALTRTQTVELPSSVVLSCIWPISDDSIIHRSENAAAPG